MSPVVAVVEPLPVTALSVISNVEPAKPELNTVYVCPFKAARGSPAATANNTVCPDFRLFG
jgi:hypothetical protein